MSGLLRVKNALSYKKPALWISLNAIVVVVVSSLLLSGCNTDDTDVNGLSPQSSVIPVNQDDYSQPQSAQSEQDILYQDIYDSGYILHRNTQNSFTLFRQDEPGGPNRIILESPKLDEPIWGTWANLWMTVSNTAQGNDVVVVSYNWGEPHIFVDSYYLYIVNGQVVAQSFCNGSLVFNKFTGISADGSRVILPNGKTASVYNDQTLQVIAQYDLVDLCVGAYDDVPMMSGFRQEQEAGNGENYDIEGYGDGYLVLKGSSSKLSLIAYPDSGQLDVVYKEVLSSEEQKAYEDSYMDGPQGVEVMVFEFEGEKDRSLVFTIQGRRTENFEIEYRYQLK